ncbi:MAG: trypsin-like peptidase domain-containing protein [Nitrospira sp.]|nr:trypsin-like peptidase domain-containing protein [Nitrospira sp.]
MPAQIRKASSLSIGEQVYAIGTPRGLDYSLSAGVVSQLRSDADDAPFIQTDATVAPGSSGGGLFDAKGNLVGITTEKISDGEITFAIPTEWILDLE